MHTSCSGEGDTRHRVHLKMLACTVIAFMIVLSAEFSMAASPEYAQTCCGRSLSLFGPEGFEWRLVEVNGMPASPPAGERRPFVKFDAAKKKVTGFAGCNNFFGSYEINESALKFGPLGATRMFCEGVSGDAEMRFMQALDKTRGWKIRDRELLLVGDSDVLARFAMAQGDALAPDLGSMTFLSGWFPVGTVTLSQGEYRGAAAPDSASEIIVKLSDKKVFGMVNGRETGAVVIFTSAGGTGIFYDLALLSRGAGGWVNLDTVLLGDRVQVHAVEIKNKQIVVALTAHGPNDPMCCPTLEVQKRFAVQGDRLVSASDGLKDEGPRITGTVWHWVQTLYNDDRRSVPAKPENYTVQFLEDGRINVKADCNLKGGVYSTEGKRLSIEMTHSTMAACEEGSLEELFVRDLTAGAIFFLKDGDLYIDLTFDTGTIKLSRQKE